MGEALSSGGSLLVDAEQCACTCGRASGRGPSAATWRSLIGRATGAVESLTHRFGSHTDHAWPWVTASLATERADTTAAASVVDVLAKDLVDGARLTAQEGDESAEVKGTLASPRCHVTER